MRVLLKVWSSNPDYNGGCSYAAVEMSDQLAKLTLRRIDILNEQTVLDPASTRRITGTIRPSISVPGLCVQSRRASVTSGAQDLRNCSKALKLMPMRW